MALQLKDGRVIEGKLVGFDQYMNLVLEESEERHTPPKTEEAAGTTSRRLGTVILRGNNVVTIAPQ
jgi:small nuclear ribonucleoprotein